jgi:quercetin dioxygenase-like cupin family protein
MNFKRHIAFALVGASLAAGTVWGQHDGHRIVTPEDLKWDNAASLPPGAKIAVIDGKINQEGPIIFRVKLPANYRIPPHFHATHERVTMISGTLNIGRGDKFDPQKTTAMKPGTVNLMPPKMPHFAWTSEETVFQLNVMGPWTVTYLNPADDPRKQ